MKSVSVVMQSPRSRERHVVGLLAHCVILQTRGQALKRANPKATGGVADWSGVGCDTAAHVRKRPDRRVANKSPPLLPICAHPAGIAALGRERMFARLEDAVAKFEASTRA
ncbi:hypothetical protein [Variovorax sp. HW608]|uniref:hypothetical protein n=1 Tax=Variovorax sp. HW608 TaxID=1034889 RepID=UPI0012FD8BFB|nr:hypothetical protein [Variovorax sp. HW608]